MHSLYRYNVSFVGHLAGLLAGLLYLHRPELKRVGSRHWLAIGGRLVARIPVLQTNRRESDDWGAGQATGGVGGGAVNFSVGDIVAVSGLRGTPELNGARGHVIETLGAAHTLRHIVALDGVTNPVSIAPANLSLAHLPRQRGRSRAHEGDPPDRDRSPSPAPPARHRQREQSEASQVAQRPVTEESETPSAEELRRRRLSRFGN